MPARRRRGGTAGRSTASSPTCRARRPASCAAIRTASGCGASRTSAASREQQARLLDGAVAAASRRAARSSTRPARCFATKTRRRSTLSWRDTPDALRETITFAPEVAARGRPTLAFAGGRAPQSGRFLLRAAPQGLTPAPDGRGAVPRASGSAPMVPAAARHRRSRHAPSFAPVARCAPAAAARPWAVLVAAGARARGAGSAAPARADTIPVKSAELRVEEGEVLLNAEFDFSLNPTLEEALQKGIPLYFVLEFELDAPRAGTGSTRRSLRPRPRLPRLVQRADAPVPGRERPARADVQLAGGGRALHRRASRRAPVARARRSSSKGTRYDAAVRLRLDVNQLPKPFQVNALASREWTLASDWHRWSFTP